MPTYEYQCQACNHCLEVFQKISDGRLSKCPECGKNTLQKQISASAFQLKGSGWYVTDFRNKEATKGDKPAETTTETVSPDTKTKETPEKKTETKVEPKKAEPAPKTKTEA